MADYPSPVDRLLTLGDVRGVPKERDYRELGIGPEHIPDLIRMAADPELLWTDAENAEVWTPIHAWRALGQLRAVEAIEPLLALLDPLLAEDDAWILDELPDVFGQIGPPAIPALTAYLADTSHDLYARTDVTSSLARIGNAHPEARAEAIAALVRQLERHAANDEILNGFLISALLDLKAVEATPAMERAFAAESVDESITGDWDYAQVALGLKEPSELPMRRVIFPFDSNPEPMPFSLLPKADPKTKSKRQQAKKSRKVNRKRK